MYGDGKKHKGKPLLSAQKTALISWEIWLFQVWVYHFLLRLLLRKYVTLYLSHKRCKQDLGVCLASHKVFKCPPQTLTAMKTNRKYNTYWSFDWPLPSFFSPLPPLSTSKKQERQDLEIKSNVQFIFITWNWNKRCFERAYKWNGRHMLNSTLWQ